MKIRSILSLILGLFVLFCEVPFSIAEQQLTDKQKEELARYEEESNRKNFRGWQGIALYCPVERQTNLELKAICEKTLKNASFLAASAKINLLKIKDASMLGFLSRIGHYLILEVDLTATSEGPPAAVHAAIKAYSGYSSAIEKSSVSEDKNNPRENPHSGDLIFWEKEVIGASSGTIQDLVFGMSEEIEQILKQFFTAYLKAQTSNAGDR